MKESIISHATLSELNKRYSRESLNVRFDLFCLSNSYHFLQNTHDVSNRFCHAVFHTLLFFICFDLISRASVNDLSNIHT